MEMEPVLFEKDGPLGWLTLNRPKNRNALSVEVMNAMQNKLNMCAKDEDIRVVVIRGSGPAFCAGHDLKEMVGAHYDAHHFRKIFTVCSDMMQALHKLPQPVIAQVHGIATAGGLQLVAACDLAIAESGTRFSTPGVKIGLFCSTPMVPLVRVIGRRKAMDMLLTGRFVSAEEAEQFGLINRIAAADKLAEETRNWAMEIAQYSRFTLALGKQAFYNQIDLDEPAAYNYAADAMVAGCLAADAQEGMAAFLEKRQPIWKHK